MKKAPTLTHHLGILRKGNPNVNKRIVVARVRERVVVRNERIGEEGRQQQQQQERQRQQQQQQQAAPQQPAHQRSEPIRRRIQGDMLRNLHERADVLREDVIEQFG